MQLVLYVSLNVCQLRALQRCVLLVLGQVFVCLVKRPWRMVAGVVVFCSFVVKGIDWCVLCTGGCGITDPHSVSSTL